MAESSPQRKKTLWKKEKLLVMSNFSFFRSVFKRLILKTRKNKDLLGKGLMHLARVNSENKKTEASDTPTEKALARTDISPREPKHIDSLQGDHYLPHDNPCFQCNISITNFLV